MIEARSLPIHVIIPALNSDLNPSVELEKLKSLHGLSPEHDISVLGSKSRAPMLDRNKEKLGDIILNWIQDNS